MTSIGLLTDSDLQEKHRHSLGGEKKELEKELKRRDFFQDTNGNWYKEPIDVSEVPSFMGIGYLIVLLVVYVGVLILLPKAFGETIVGFYSLLMDVTPYVPTGNPFSIETIQEKIILISTSFTIASFLWTILFFIKLLTGGKLKVSFISIPTSLFFGVSSLFFLYVESTTRNDINFWMTFIFLITLIVSLLTITRIKKFWIAGLMVSIISTVGYILDGNGLIAPFFLLSLAGFQLCLNKGSFRK